MKHKPDEKQITWAITIFGLFLACLFVYCLIFRSSGYMGAIKRLAQILTGIIYGVILAYILTPVVNFLERKFMIPVYEKKGIRVVSDEKEAVHRKRMRGLSVLISMVLFLAVLMILFLICIPSLYRSITSLINAFPSYIRNFRKWLESLLVLYPENPMLKEVLKVFNDFSNQILNVINTRVIPNMDKLVDLVTTYLTRFISGIVNTFVGLIVAIYILFAKEEFLGQSKKFCYAFFKEHIANEIISTFRHIHYTFIGFLVGKIIDSVLIGLLCYVGTYILAIPYAGLVSVLVGFTNIIPVFGPYIGAVIGGFFVLIIDPFAALRFLIFVLILQQFDGNILGPRILGDTTGISSFWVLFSIIFFGGIFGIPGMILGVPLFACFYHGMRRLIHYRLAKKGMPVKTYAYTRAAYSEDGKLVSYDEAHEDKFHTRKPDAPWKAVLRLKNRKEDREESLEESLEDQDIEKAGVAEAEKNDRKEAGKA